MGLKALTYDEDHTTLVTSDVYRMNVTLVRKVPSYDTTGEDVELFLEINGKKIYLDRESVDEINNVVNWSGIKEKHKKETK